MRISRLSAILATATILSSLQFSSPSLAHADTYQVTAPLWFENEQAFEGIDASGNIYINNFDKYSTLLNGVVVSTSSIKPTFVSDRGSICTTPVPGFTPISGHEICNGSSVAFLVFPSGSSAGAIYTYSGTGTPQLAAPAPNGDLLAFNSLGDIVFDNGFYDYAYEAIDVTRSPGATPEAPTLFLLATGILALGMALRRRPVLAGL